MTSYLATLLILAAQTGGFATLKDKAQQLDRPGAAIGAIVGLCEEEDPLLQMECQKNVKTERAKYKGGRYYIDLGANHQDLLMFEGMHGKKARLLWVPMYDPGDGQPLTAVRPKRVTKDGWPILQKKVLDGVLPAEVHASDLRRLSRLGQLNIEIVGSFGAPWALKNKGKIIRGVVFKIVAIRISQARTGEQVMEVVY